MVFFILYVQMKARCLRFSLHKIEPRRKHEIFKHGSASQLCIRRLGVLRTSSTMPYSAKQSGEVPWGTLSNCKQDDNECNP